MNAKNRAKMAALAVILTIAVLPGCSASGPDSSSDAGSGADKNASTKMDMAGPEGDAGMAVGEPAPSVAADLDTASQEASRREVITTGAATLIASDVAQATKAVITLTEDSGGRVERQQEWAAQGDQQAGAELTVRVPAATTTATIEALRGLGEVQDVSINAEDVTATGQDLDARIKSLQTSIDRLLTLMEKATTTEDLLAAERELTSRQGELESLQSQRKLLTDQVAMSTLTISIQAKAGATEIKPGGFMGGLRSGWDALLTALNAIVVALGAVVPWLIPVAVLGGLFLWLRRRFWRSRAHPTGSTEITRGQDS